MSKNYVCDGAKIECQLCTKPEGTLMVTSNQIKIQGQLFANENDKGKPNLMFQGNCKASPYQASPCMGVIAPIAWQGTADALIQGGKALLEDSTIMCGFGGSEIKITDHLQTNQPTQLQPLGAPVVLPVEEPKYLELQWSDRDDQTITENSIDQQHKATLKTLNILPGESLLFNISEKENTAVRNEDDKVRIEATVNHDGEAKIEIQNTAQDVIEEKTKDAPQIEEMYWMDSEGNPIENASSGEQVHLYVKVTNLEEGEELTINLDSDDDRTTITGVVDAEGIVVLK